MINVGQKVMFKPLAGIHFIGSKDELRDVVGTVTFVHKEHQWFMVEYGDDVKLKVGFKFTDIGMGVKLV